MVDERKPSDAYRRPTPGGDDGTGDESEPDADTTDEPVGVGQLTATERDEINALFERVNGDGYLTVGGWQVSVDDDQRKTVTFTAMLPSSVADARDGGE